MGNPVVHWELWSKDPDALARFYAEVFEWDIQPMPEMNYHFVDTRNDEGINGGFMTPKEGPWPGNMALYVEVDDLEACRAKVEAAGGATLVAHQAIPGMGSFALFSDPDQRVFGVWKVQR